MTSDAEPTRQIVLDLPGQLGTSSLSAGHGTTLVGVVAPYDLALDRELWRWVPADVSLLFTRTPYAPLEVTVEMADWVSRPETVRRSARDLGSVGPAACVYASATGSFARGLAGERGIGAELELWTTMTALGCRAVGPHQRLLGNDEGRVVVNTEYGLRPA